MKKQRIKNKQTRRRMPKKENISAVIVDKDKKSVFFITRDILSKQIYREGPRIAASFDELTRDDIAECSELFSFAQARLFRHLPKVEDNGFEATSARLLFSAANSYVAAVEVGRRGYARQHGALSRMVVETIATVLAIAVNAAALEKFHAEKLESTKCIGMAKAVLPFIGGLYGMLSNNFVHIGTAHAEFEGPKIYSKGDERLGFIITSSKMMALLLDISTELIFAQDQTQFRYWKKEGRGWRFSPSDEVMSWMEAYAPKESDPPASIEPPTVPIDAS